MEKTVKITGFEEKEGTKGSYWKVSTSPALIEKKALFIHKEEQIQLLEKDKFYNFVYNTNEKGFINIEAFEEVIDVNEEDLNPKKGKPSAEGSYREITSLFQTKLNGAISMWVAKVGQGCELSLEDLDIYYQKLEDLQKEKLG